MNQVLERGTSGTLAKRNWMKAPLVHQPLAWFPLFFWEFLLSGLLSLHCQAVSSSQSSLFHNFNFNWQHCRDFWTTILKRFVQTLLGSLQDNKLGLSLSPPSYCLSVCNTSNTLFKIVNSSATHQQWLKQQPNMTFCVCTHTAITSTIHEQILQKIICYCCSCVCVNSSGHIILLTTRGLYQEGISISPTIGLSYTLCTAFFCLTRHKAL